MYRRSLSRLLPFAEAKRLFLRPDGTPLATPTAALPTLLEALQTNYRTAAAATATNSATPTAAAVSVQEREALVAAAMAQVIQLDREDADSRLLAAWVEEAAGAATGSAGAAAANAVNGDAKRTTTTTTAGEEEDTKVSVLVELMKAYPHNIAIREMCCRCLANICQLSAAAAAASSSPSTPLVGDDNTTTTATTTTTTATAAYSLAVSSSPGERLVAQGAMEQALGTMRAAHRLSPRGRCWVAMAVLNLVCLSRSGARRAGTGAASAEEVLSEYILFLVEEQGAAAAAGADGNNSNTTTNSSYDGGLTVIALDAALGALAGVLAAEAPENARGVSFNFERVSYTALDALVRTLLAVSAVMVRDGRNDGAYNASLPSRRYGKTVDFAGGAVTPLQRRAVVTLLPLLHKGWMALQQASSHRANLPVIFDTLYGAANANQEGGGRVAGEEEEDYTNSTNTEGDAMLEVDATTERRYQAALTTVFESGLFLTTELEGVAAVAPELARLQADLSLSVMEVMAAMTSTLPGLKARIDADAEAGGGGERAEDDDVNDADANGEDSNDTTPSSSSPAIVAPTPAAIGVAGVLSSGLVSSMALATAVRVHTDHQENIDSIRAAGASTSKNAAELTPYPGASFSLLSKSLSVLCHLGSATEDEVALSANTIAALQAMLRDTVDIAKGFPGVYGGDVTGLFKPVEQDVDGNVINTTEAVRAITDGTTEATATEERLILPGHRLALMQHLAIVGLVYAVLYAVLRTPDGVQLVLELEVPVTAQELQDSLTFVYGPALEAAKVRYGGRMTTDKETGKPVEEKWTATVAEESVLRLTKLGDGLLTSLAKIAAKSK